MKPKSRNRRHVAGSKRERPVRRDNFGNRNVFRDTKVPADNIGNRIQKDDDEDVIQDSIGNQIEQGPTHLLSGVLAELGGKKSRVRQLHRDAFNIGLTETTMPFSGFRSTKTKKRQERKTKVNESANSESRRRTKRSSSERLDNSKERIRRWLQSNARVSFSCSKSNPEEKRLLAKRVVQTIYEKAGVSAKVDAKLVEQAGESRVVVVVYGEHFLFEKCGDVIFALNYLVNKIINRFPDDRIRLTIVPKEFEVEVSTIEKHESKIDSSTVKPEKMTTSLTET